MKKLKAILAALVVFSTIVPVLGSAGSSGESSGENVLTDDIVAIAADGAVSGSTATFVSSIAIGTNPSASADANSGKDLSGNPCGDCTSGATGGTGYYSTSVTYSTAFEPRVGSASVYFNSQATGDGASTGAASQGTQTNTQLSASGGAGASTTGPGTSTTGSLGNNDVTAKRGPGTTSTTTINGAAGGQYANINIGCGASANTANCNGNARGKGQTGGSFAGMGGSANVVKKR